MQILDKAAKEKLHIQAESTKFRQQTNIADQL